RAGVVRGSVGAAAGHRHGAERGVLHGTDPARRPDRQKRHHPARLHPIAHARRGGGPGNRDPRGGEGAAAANPDDDAVHAVRFVTVGTWHRRGQRAATAARVGGHRGVGPFHPDYVVRRTYPARGDPRRGLPAAVTDRGMVWSLETTTLSGVKHAPSFHTYPGGGTIVRRRTPHCSRRDAYTDRSRQPRLQGENQRGFGPRDRPEARPRHRAEYRARARAGPA